MIGGMSRTSALALIAGAALAMGSFAATAADLGDVTSMKDPLPDTLSYHGVTLYGTIDVGGAYSSNAVPGSGAFYVGADTTIYGSPYANKSVATLTNNALEQSKVGLKIEENIGYGFAAIGKLESGFNPISGEISDACASLLRNNGKLYSQMDVNGDGSRCGQAFNGAAYGGLSNPMFGTVTFGRQNSLVNDGMGVYDPMGGSYAFSLIGYSGTPGAGIGSTETARWDDSVKYVYTYGPVHVSGMFTDGGQDTSMMGTGYGGNAGFAWKGFSLDGYYTKENGAVNLSSFANSAYSLSSSACVAGSCPNALSGKVTNNEAWDIMGKYTLDVPSVFGYYGGYKDEAPSAKLTFFGGYQHVDMSNPDHTQDYYNGYDTQNGYMFDTTSHAVNLFGSDKILETAWAGAKYETGPWAFTGAYYYWHQDAYNAIGQLYTAGASALNSTFTSNSCAAVTASNTAINNNVTKLQTSNAKFQGLPGNLIGSNCAGEVNEGSFLVDYKFNKHFDVYTGVTYSDISGGLSSGFLKDDNMTVVSGLRLKF